jgi:hypothetical protein
MAAATSVFAARSGDIAFGESTLKPSWSNWPLEKLVGSKLSARSAWV